MTPDALLERLACYEPASVPGQGYTRSAVLVPFRRRSVSDLEIVLTRRTEELEAHAGQVAFPGGRVEPEDDSPEKTAIREASEELGVPQAAFTALGRLDEMVTITRYHVVPVVGLVSPNVAFTPSEHEVARVFELPTSVLLDPEKWEKRRHLYRGHEVWLWHLPYDNEDIWGVTAMILRGMTEWLWRA